MPRRTYRIVESRMIADWFSRAHPGCRKILRCWLGPIPESTALARAGVTPRVLMPFGGGWVDGIIMGPDWTRLVESAVVSGAVDLGQLDLYLDLFRETREFRDRWDTELIPVLLYGFGRAAVLRLAERKGVEAVRFCPDYIRDYYHEKVGMVPRR